MQNLFSLTPSGIENICELSDEVNSIAFCNILDGLFFTDMERHAIVFVNFKGQMQLWRNDAIENPKGICMNENHSKMFYEDNKNIFTGCWIKGKNYFNVLGKNSKDYFNPIQVKRARSLDQIQRMRHFCFCDHIQSIVATMCAKNSILYIDSSGKHKTMIGSGRKDFCMSNDRALIAMNNPTGITYLPKSKDVVVSDTNNHVVRRFCMGSKSIEREVIGQPTKQGCEDSDFSKSLFSFPSELCSFNDKLYVIDGEKNKLIRKIDLVNNKVETVYKTEKKINSISCSDDTLFILESFI